MTSPSEQLAGLSLRQRAALEAVLARRRAARPEEGTAPRPAGDEPAPLSFSQQRLWFVDQLEAGSSFYNISAAFRLCGALRPGDLARALAEVVRRHEVLRTVFPECDGQPVQVVQPPGPGELPVVDLAPLPAGEREREVRRRVLAEARRPFDLARGPLLRCRLLRLAPDEHVIACTVHHIVVDWWSLGVLIREIAVAYRAFSRGAPCPLPELPLQFRDLAIRQRRGLAGAALAEQTSYWERQLAGVPTFLALPTDRPRPAVQGFGGARQACAFPADLSAGLETLARGEGCTLFMVLLAAYQALLHHLAGADDLVVSSPVSGRQHGESEGLIGFFVNTLLFRADLSGDPTFRELLARTRGAVLDAFAHQHLPLERVIERLAPERQLSYSPLLQVSLNYLDRDWRQDLGLSELTAEPFEIETGDSQFELNLIVQRTDRGLDGVLQYKTALFERRTVIGWLDGFRRLLDQVVSDPGITLSALGSTLGRQEQARRHGERRRLEQTSLEKFKQRKRKAVGAEG